MQFSYTHDMLRYTLLLHTKDGVPATYTEVFINSFPCMVPNMGPLLNSLIGVWPNSANSYFMTNPSESHVV
jgi:hypothetical protein